MQSKAATPDQYVSEIADDKREAFILLRKTILDNLPKGFEKEMSYGMIGYVVPLSIYSKGYKNPKLPLPLMNLAAQKNFIALHHMGIYSLTSLLKWFTDEYPRHSKLKLDMGKGCIRFKNMSQIPYDLVGKLVKKMEVDDWVNIFESYYLKNKSINH